MLKSTHDLTVTPQPLADQWMGRCSCGGWSATASLNEMDRHQALAELRRQLHGHITRVTGATDYSYSIRFDMSDVDRIGVHTDPR
jgi:hypothetical protein